MANTKKEWYVEVLEGDEWVRVTDIVTHAESSEALTEWIGRRKKRARAIYVGNPVDRPAGLANLLRGQS